MYLVQTLSAARNEPERRDCDSGVLGLHFLGALALKN